MTTTPMNQGRNRRWSLIPRLALGLPILASSVIAQDTGEDVYIMDPFTITAERDTGYSASNSIAGTRTNTPIREIPMNIQVFTKDLADDFLLTSQVDMERYNASLVNGGGDVHSSNAIQQAYNGFLFRGFIQNWGLRDGVRVYDPVDSMGLARVEIVKGPAAVMYGVTYPGGVMNSISKEADFIENFAQFRLTADLDGEVRATVDANVTGELGGGKLGIRYAGAKVESQDHRSHSGGKVDYQMVNLVWLPAKGTKISLTGESGYREKPNGLGYFTTGGVGDGVDIPLQITHPEIPWTWNWAVGNMRSAKTEYFRGVITHSFNDDFSVNAYAQYLGRHQIDSNGWNAAGQGASAAAWDMGWSNRGGNVTGWINPNTPDEKIAMHHHYRHWANSNWAAGATAVYRLNFQEISNTITAGAHTWYERFNTKKGTQPENSPNIIYFPVRANIDLNIPAGPPYDYFWDRPERENSASSFYFASWQMSALDNRLRTNIGVNQTQLNLKSLRTAGDDPHFYWTKSNETKMDKWSPMVGAMYDVTKEVSIFGVYSTSLFPTTDKDTLMNPLPPIEGKSIEFGTKLELMDGKISGTISYFQITQTGGAQNDPAAPNVDTLRWDSMTPEQRALQFPGRTREQLLGDLVPGAEQESKGFEADIVISPNANWQVLLSYAHVNQETTDAVNRALLGQSTEGLVKDQLSFLTKYSFTEGVAEGLSLGLGGQIAGKALQGYHSSSGQARYNPSTFYLEAFAGYRFELFGQPAILQLNAKNITQQDEFAGWKETGNASVWATERYKVPTEARFSLTFGMDF